MSRHRLCPFRNESVAAASVTLNCECRLQCLSFLQGFVKSRLEEAAVSQRDLQRTFNLLAFYIRHHNQRRRELPDTVSTSHQAVVHRSLLLNIAVAYFFRPGQAAEAGPPDSNGCFGRHGQPAGR